MVLVCELSHQTSIAAVISSGTHEADGLRKHEIQLLDNLAWHQGFA
jgi:hypothetical protein